MATSNSNGNAALEAAAAAAQVQQPGTEWPAEAEEKYERLEVIGKGSFGMVWMSRRVTPPVDDFDDEYVAVKHINIKDEKGKVYAEREICILQELRHPHVIRLIRAFPVHGVSRLVIMQLARGPNLHQLIVKRGALGLPLCRQVARQLIAAVSYLHGRAVIHRDIKPSNCILASTTTPLTEDYDWFADHAIWSNGAPGQNAVDAGRWKLMLVDFGFARALEKEEIYEVPKRHLRNSIIYESEHGQGKSPAIQKAIRLSVTARHSVNAVAPRSSARKSGKNTTNNNSGHNENKDGAAAAPMNTTIYRAAKDDGEDSEEDMEDLDKMCEAAALNIGHSFEATNEVEQAIMGAVGTTKAPRQRLSGISMQLPNVNEDEPQEDDGVNNLHRNQLRQSTARHKVRSMSALGTKAFAAPEIRKKLRHKNDEDFSKANAAMTECVADYGMIVDAYSVGWTLRVAMTGVPPNFTISEYMHERANVICMNDPDEDYDDDDAIYGEGCCCFAKVEAFDVKIRDPCLLPHEAMLLISNMTEKNPEDRITVREAQHHPYIAGLEGEEDMYICPQGDVPSRHGDPVIPLECAAALSKLTVEYHMQ